jgi:antitoxin PrlF
MEIFPCPEFISLFLDKFKVPYHIPFMSHTSTLTSKNQTTIPKAIVDALKIKPSATLCYDLEPDGSVRLTAKTASFSEMAGKFLRPLPGKTATVMEMKAAVKAAAAQRFKKQKP